MFKTACDFCKNDIPPNALIYTVETGGIHRPDEHFCSYGCLAKYAVKQCGWEIKENV